MWTRNDSEMFCFGFRSESGTYLFFYRNFIKFYFLNLKVVKFVLENTLIILEKLRGLSASNYVYFFVHWTLVFFVCPTLTGRVPVRSYSEWRGRDDPDPEPKKKSFRILCVFQDMQRHIRGVHRRQRVDTWKKNKSSSKPTVKSRTQVTCHEIPYSYKYLSSVTDPDPGPDQGFWDIENIFSDLRPPSYTVCLLKPLQRTFRLHEMPPARQKTF